MKKRIIIRGVSFIIALTLMLSQYILPKNANAVGYTNEECIYSYLRHQMNLSPAAACGILANIEKESYFNPLALGDNGTSFGIVQWHKSRYDNLKNYCRSNGYDYTTLYGQLKFFDYEINSSYSKVIRRIRAVPDNAQGAYESGFIFCHDFEIPANKEVKSAERGNLAKNTYFPKYSKKEIVDIYGVKNDTDNTDTPIIIDSDNETDIESFILAGDVNCDGNVNMIDVVTLQQIIAGLSHHYVFGEYSSKNSDYNADLKIDMLDVIAIQKHIANL